MSDPALNRPRILGAINWLGLWTLYQKEVRRFLKVTAQTVIGPLVMSLLFLAIFAVALGSRRGEIDGVAYTSFLAPGLVMMAITQNAFANASSSLLIAKTQGTIVDLLMAPLRPLELILAFVFAAMTRGLLVALVVAVAMTPFVSMTINHMGLLLFHALAASALLALLGILAGLWAERMDNLAAVTNFAIAPLTFLSGTFFSATDLPPALQGLLTLNPFFHMIDGFRHGFIGQGQVEPIIAVTVMLAANLAVFWLCHRTVARGWRIKP
ncbi:MAG: ABC transporter permease [Rhodospirillaceae bacterium]|jgi:ABC-2 type transport system permease protein|nr:ABC transporter permease [Rhodospirillaceae bacterium]MBT5082984.1 ABC transporter permease [Rhodospirillaceae bacterium]MBT5524428.1 ABC transporter permease [Rhodospirillaceae bacterium]MBT5878776.1 ABC transporter permease [Rhodospirillaceae bacterium]MBT6591555.1 ABC transporter permease [Rhodospirillaceae bacterium]